MHTLSGKLHISAPSGVVRIKDVAVDTNESMFGHVTYINMEDVPEVATLLLKLFMENKINNQ